MGISCCIPICIGCIMPGGGMKSEKFAPLPPAGNPAGAKPCGGISPSIGGSPGGTKPILWLTGKKLRRKCSDLIAAFTGFPLKVCDLSHKTTSWAPSSTLNFTNQVLFTSGLTLTTLSAKGPADNSCTISSSVVPSGKSRRMTTFLLDLSTGRTIVFCSSTPRRLDFAAAAATCSFVAPKICNRSCKSKTEMGMYICGFILLAKNWSLTKPFLDSIDSKVSWICSSGDFSLVLGASAPPGVSASICLFGSKRAAH
mmetsp:Transcript_27607/g.60117  ORF Transcript_27607/g.60117 Transcript_27607/m.60117 type:complete len:255 (+) Transcript_27607:529-1293(+)